MTKCILGRPSSDPVDQRHCSRDWTFRNQPASPYLQWTPLLHLMEFKIINKQICNVSENKPRLRFPEYEGERCLLCKCWRFWRGEGELDGRLPMKWWGLGCRSSLSSAMLPGTELSNDEVMRGRLQLSSLTSVSPLMRSDSATLRKAVRRSWSTDTSPLYMKSSNERMSA